MSLYHNINSVLTVFCVAYMWLCKEKIPSVESSLCVFYSSTDYLPNYVYFWLVDSAGVGTLIKRHYIHFLVSVRSVSI